MGVGRKARMSHVEEITCEGKSIVHLRKCNHRRVSRAWGRLTGRGAGRVDRP